MSLLATCGRDDRGRQQGRPACAAAHSWRAHNRPRPSRTPEMLALHMEMEDLYETFQPQLDFIRAIRDTLPDDGIFVEEITQVGYASRVFLPVYQPRTFIASGYQG